MVVVVVASAWWDDDDAARNDRLEPPRNGLKLRRAAAANCPFISGSKLLDCILSGDVAGVVVVFFLEDSKNRGLLPLLLVLLLPLGLATLVVVAGVPPPTRNRRLP